MFLLCFLALLLACILAFFVTNIQVVGLFASFYLSCPCSYNSSAFLRLTFLLCHFGTCFLSTSLIRSTLIYNLLAALLLPSRSQLCLQYAGCFLAFLVTSNLGICSLAFFLRFFVCRFLALLIAFSLPKRKRLLYCLASFHALLARLLWLILS